MELSDIRKEIDGIDAQLVKLFCQRMELAAQVADYKKEHNLPIFVPGREQEILERTAQQAGPEMAEYVTQLYSVLFDISRSYQAKHNEVI